jgi:hypothetical protein
VQRGGAHQLHVERPLPERPPGGLAHGPENLREQIVQSLAVGVALLEQVSLGAQLGVAHLSEIFFDRIDLLADPLELAQDPAFASAKDTIDYGWHFSSRSSADRFTL